MYAYLHILHIFNARIAIRKDAGMMKGYMFIIDFLQIVSAESEMRIKKNQKLLLSLLDACKRGDDELIQLINTSYDDVTSSDFLVHLDCEIENQNSNSVTENMLVTLKLLLIEEVGKRKGDDILMLSKLAAEDDDDVLDEKTREYFKKYDVLGKQLFLQTFLILKSDMKKRYACILIHFSSYDTHLLHSYSVL